MKKIAFASSLLLCLAGFFFSCQKDAQQIVPEVKVEQTADYTATDRTNPETLKFDFSASTAVELQYRVTNAAGTSIYFSHSFSSASGTTSSGIPGLDGCPRVQVRGRRIPNGSGTVSWELNRTTCDPLTGTLNITASAGTPWSSIPWVTIQAAACPCI